MLEESTPMLSVWFEARPRWLQLAAASLCCGTDLDQELLSKLENACIREARGTFKDELPPFDISALAQNTTTSTELRLTSLSEPKGINALAPRKPLLFGSVNLIIVYGHNGSGKSGYTRALKHLCGARRPGKLHPNVFGETNATRGVTVSFKKDGKDETRVWSVGEPAIPELRSVLIFDSEAAEAYLTEECEVVYEPRTLAFFTQLVGACDAVNARIGARLRELQSSLPALPPKYEPTPSGTWYRHLTAFTASEDISARCAWSESDTTRLSELRAELTTECATSAPNAKEKLKNLEELLERSRALYVSFGDDVLETVMGLRAKVQRADEAATLAAQTEFGATTLPAVGEEAWLQMWAAARRYSEEHVYPGDSFPRTTEDTRCVLCQQVLDNEGVSRLMAFDAFVRGELRQKAESAQQQLGQATSSLPSVPDEAELSTQLDASRISKPEIRQALFSYYEALRNRREKALSERMLSTNWDVRPLLDSIEELLAPPLAELRNALRQQVPSELARDRVALSRDLLELEGRQWLGEQRLAIAAEVERKQQIAVLEKARASTNTTALSRKKGELAEQLISSAFQLRFQNELTLLRGQRVRVKLEKTRVERGHALHQLRVNSNKHLPPLEVLSEGERRVISLAAFLADAAGDPAITPFIFDDPISSLDQDFEEAVVTRVIELGKQRQVIVFTHRLSLLVLLQEAAQSSKLAADTLCVRNEPWGAGEPSEIPLDGKKPVAALRKLRDERLARALKVYEQTGYDEYAPLAKALCSDFRILLERLVEVELLADVVQRFRRAINTKGKLHKLAHITKSDTDLIEALMTKYSVYEHSQPLDAPGPPASPGELRADLERVIAWHDEFVTRAVN